MSMKNQDEIREVLRTIAARHNSLFEIEDALDALHGYGDELVEALIDALDDPDNDVRLLVLGLFWELGAKAEPAVPSLINLLEDSNKVVRICAADVVARFGEKARTAVPILETWIGGEDRSSHVNALGNIMMIDPTRAVDLLPVLTEALESDDSMIRCEAVWVIGSLGELARAAIPALKPLLDDHSTVSMSASDAIHEITDDPTDAIMVGLNLLDEEEWLQRYVGAEHLGLLGQKARPAIPRLRRAATDDDDEAVRNAAQMALLKIDV